jgi:hypothetical protein
MESQNRIPTIAALLGYGGLIPFLGCVAAAWAGIPAGFPAIEAFLAYAAVILAFLGGIHWGMALAPAGEDFALRLVVGVLPPLIGWLALLLPSPPALVMLAAGFALVLAWDRARGGRGTRGWYLRLRTNLSLVAIACHAALLPIAA